MTGWLFQESRMSIRSSKRESAAAVHCVGRLTGVKVCVFACGLALALLSAPTATSQTDDEQQARLMQLYDRMIQFNLKDPQALPEQEINAQMSKLDRLAVGEKIAAWAEYFHKRNITTYRFGLKPGGYANEGRLVDDFRPDCVLFFYRVTELGRSSTALEAVQFAFGTRFYGATLEDVVSQGGRVDYDSPAHLDFTVDIVRSGIWGKEITDTLGVAVSDDAGSTRYPPGDVKYLPKGNINLPLLQDGDIVYFVSDETTDHGKTVRESGALIGHLGIIKVERSDPYLIHAASSGLEGIYEGGKVEKVKLAIYLERVESFKGIVATRIESF